MDDKRKIVLATEDILAKKLEDIFINVNLQQTFKQIKRDKFDNNFDLAEQFRKERNASRSFRIYGIIDSPIVNCAPRIISVYSDSELTQLVDVVQSTQIGFGDKNVFGKRRGKYLIELNNYTDSNDVWLRIKTDGVNFGDTVVKVPLVFYTPSGEFIEYGTDTIDLDLNGEFTTVSNDFPFFYDKHWIKNNFQLEKVLIRNISFENTNLTINEGQLGQVVIALSDPSFFGKESVVVSITTPDISTYEIAIQSSDFQGPFPATINWAAGEQYKTLNISAIQDYLYEKNIEYFTIGLSNPSNATIGEGIVNINEMQINIVNTDERRVVNYDFQKIIQNTTPIPSADFAANLTSAIEFIKLNIFGAKFEQYAGNTSINGIPIDNQNRRFYPNDSFELEIINRGLQAVIPPVQGFSTTDRVLAPDESFVLRVNSQYENQSSLPLETAILNFKYENGTYPPTDLYRSKFYINGITFGEDGLTAVKFEEEVQRVYSELGIEIPFSISRQGRVVTLVATHPANTINVLIPEGSAQVVNTVITSNFTYEQTVVEEPRFALENDAEVPEYVVPPGAIVAANGRVPSITPQIPFNISLNANFANNTQCKYEFIIRKPGYKEFIIPAQGIAASANSNKAYLVSGIRNVFGPPVIPGQSLSCVPDEFSTLNIEGFYLNGAALIADAISATNISEFNQSDITLYPSPAAVNETTSGFVAEFRTAPLSSNVINCNDLIELSSELS